MEIGKQTNIVNGSQLH